MKKMIPAAFTAAMFLFVVLYFHFSTKNEYQLVAASQHDGYTISVPAHAVVGASKNKLLHDTSPVLIILGFLIAVGGIAYTCSSEYIEDKPTGYVVKLGIYALVGFCLAFIPVEHKYASPSYETHILQKNFEAAKAEQGGYDDLFPEVNELPLLKQQ